MAIPWLLCVFFLQALRTLAEPVLGCAPKKPETRDPVENCNYYCGKNEHNQWMMGYYENGTKCQHYEGGEGVCLDLGPEREGCYATYQDEVRKFYEHSSTTRTSSILPSTKKSRRSKEKSKRPKTPKNKTKPSKPKKNRKSPRKQKKAKKPKQAVTSGPVW